MADEIKIAYEPHPVSPKRKKELRDKGFKIIDLAHAPADVKAAAAKKDGQSDKKGE